ncbi:FAD-binding domain protein [Ceratobasidium sp. AG-Ba]|nr:FAD-binding domain protein [Ceratobasidium sp. AG-Ba]
MDDEPPEPLYPVNISSSDTSRVLDVTSPKQLPYEILSNIFARAIAANGCYENRRRQIHPLLAFRATCKYWYHVIIGNRALWSHIDVFFDGCRGDMYSFHINNSTRLWLQRSKNGPIHLHFVTGYGDSHVRMSELEQIFQPYANHIAAVTFSHQWPEEIVRDILKVCHTHAVPGTLKHLTVAKVYITENVGTSYQHLKWPMNFLRGLTSLYIGHLDDKIGLRMNQLWSILVNSPQMRILELKECHIVSSEKFEPKDIPAVPLHSLRVLELRNIEDLELLQLLQAIQTGNSRLHFGVSVDESDSTILAAIKSFIKRTRIVSLGLGQDAVEIAEDLSVLPELHTLHFDLNHGYWMRIGLLVDVTTRTPKWPNIRNLHFSNGYIRGEADRELIRCLVDAYHLKEIYFVGFTILYHGYYTNWRLDNRNEEKVMDYVTQRVDVVSTAYSDPPWDILAEKRVL